jgi:hypothetical protein
MSRATAHCRLHSHGVMVHNGRESEHRRLTARGLDPKPDVCFANLRSGNAPLGPRRARTSEI